MKRATKRLEEQFRRQGYKRIAGADEVGKGAWAGPLVAAAVIFGPQAAIPGIRDSKFLLPGARQKLFVRITRFALAWAVGIAPAEAIDRDGIQAANRLAIVRAAQRLAVRPDLLLVDAITVKAAGIPSRAVPDGDSSVRAIAAASIIAKVVRDELMRGLHRHFPRYRFDQHKGYGTDLHQRLLKRHGPSPIHRMSFDPMKHWMISDI